MVHLENANGGRPEVQAKPTLSIQIVKRRTGLGTNTESVLFALSPEKAEWEDWNAISRICRKVFHASMG